MTDPKNAKCGRLVTGIGAQGIFMMVFAISLEVVGTRFIAVNINIIVNIISSSLL